MYPIWIHNVDIISTHLVSGTQVIRSSILITCDVSHYTYTLCQNRLGLNSKLSTTHKFGVIDSDTKWEDLWIPVYIYIYTGCHRRKGPNFGRVFLMLNYTDITQNTYIQSWTVTEITAREKCRHLAFPRSVRLQLSSALTVREECVTYFFDGTSSAQRDKIAFHYCRYVQCLVTLRTTEIWVRVFL